MNRRTTITVAVCSAAAVLAVAGIIATATAGGGPLAPQPSPSPSITSIAVPPIEGPSSVEDLVVDPAVVDPSFGEPVIAVGDVQTPAAFSDGLSVSIVSLTATTVTGEGIGSVSGPAATVRLSITNTGSSAASLDAVTVNGFAGADRRPLVPAATEGSSPFAGPLAAGATVTADYGFAVDGDEASYLVTVGTGAASGLVVLEYR